MMTDGNEFLKTDGAGTEPFETLTEDDIDDLEFMYLEELDAATLEFLTAQAEKLRRELESREPEGESEEERDLREDRISEIDDFLDRVREQLEDLEETDR